MSRSIWKLKPINLNLLTQVYLNKSILQTRIRSTYIVKEFISHTIHIYNGMKYLPLLIRPIMVGYKLGDFVFTKKTIVHKLKKIKK